MRLKTFFIKSIEKHPGKVLLFFCALLMASVLMTGLLKFERDIFELLPRDNPTFQVLIHAMKRSTAQDRLFVLVKSKADGKNLGFADAAVSGLINDAGNESRDCFSPTGFAMTL